MERVNHKVFLHGQNVKCNTKFMRCYCGVLCRKIHWCKQLVIKVNSFRHCLHILIFRSNSPADIETLLESVCTAHNGKGLEQEAQKQKKHMHCQKNPFYLNLVNSNPHPLKQDAISLRFDSSFPVIYHQLTQTCLTQTQCKLKLI